VAQPQSTLPDRSLGPVVFLPAPGQRWGRDCWPDAWVDSVDATRRWLQFRLRTLLVLLAVASLPLGLLGSQMRIVRHRQALLAMVRARCHGESWRPQLQRTSYLELQTDTDHVSWFRALLGDESPAPTVLEGEAFTYGEIREITNAFPEARVTVENNSDPQLKTLPYAVAEIQRRTFQNCCQSVERPPGIISLSWLKAGCHAADGRMYVTHLGTGTLYLIKTAIAPSSPGQFRGYVYSTVPIQSLGSADSEGFIHLSIAALDPKPSTPKGPAAAVGVWAKPTKTRGWLRVSTQDD